jgi:hypothetical protein
MALLAKRLQRSIRVAQKQGELRMVVHKKIMLAILPIYEAHKQDDMSMSDIIAEMCHAAFAMSGFNEKGLARLLKELAQEQYDELLQALKNEDEELAA